VEYETSLVEGPGPLPIAGNTVDQNGILEPGSTREFSVSIDLSLIGEVSDRLRARVMATGELMATRIGAAFLAAEGVAFDAAALAALQAGGATIVGVAANDAVVGWIALADALRPEAAGAVRVLRDEGVGVVMLTGDHPSTAGRVAEAVGIGRWQAEVTPRGKREKVLEMQRAGEAVGMIGDGVNDAPALAQADVSFAMGAGSGSALSAADITILRDDLRAVPAAISLSRATIAKIRQNLFFAFVYNVLGIPLAAAGLLSPVVAGAAMALSSVSVVTNALLLKRWRPPLAAPSAAPVADARPATPTRRMPTRGHATEETR